MSTTDNLGIGLIAVNQKQKEVIANEGIAALEAKITENESIAVANGTNAVTAAQVRENVTLVLANGTPSATFAVVLPAVKNALLVRNATAHQADIQCTGGSLVYSLAAGAMALLYCDGAEVYGVAGGGGGGGGSTTFLGLTDTPATFNGSAGQVARVNGDESALEFDDLACDLALWVPGTFADSQVLARIVMPRPCVFPGDMTGASAEALGPSTGAAAVTVKKNGVGVGTIEFAASGTAGAFVFGDDVSLAAGDVFSLHAPAPADATLADLSVTFAGKRV